MTQSDTPQLVVEVGGTHVTAALVQGEQVLRQHRAALDATADVPRFVRTLIDASLQVSLQQHPWVVAIPDPFDYTTGRALFRGVGKFDRLFGADLREALLAGGARATSIAFVHDAEAFLMGEVAARAALGRRCVAITLGTGVGSAFFTGERVVRAGPGVPPDGRIHRLTLDGLVLETFVSRSALRAAYAQRTGDVEADVVDIAQRARRGDAAAADVLATAMERLGQVLAPCLIGFAARHLVVGGGMAASWDLLEPPLTRSLQAQGAVVDAGSALWPDTAALIGAPLLARQAAEPPATAATVAGATS